MERAEKQGLAVAAVGHVALFALLSLGLFSARIPKPPLADTMDVTITDTVGLKSAAPAKSEAAPKPSEAPEQGAPADSAPPPPAPEPTPPPPEPKPPVPTPPPPRPVPAKPRPAPEKPAPPRPEPKPVAKPEPKPEKPEPAPEKPRPAPEKRKPAPEKPRPAPEKTRPTPEKARPEKSAKAAPAKAAAPAKSAARPSTAKAPGLPSDFLKDLPKDAGTGKTGSTAKPKGSRLGKDFLKGIGGDAAGKADAPRAAAVSARSMSGLIGIIAARVKPCYNPPAGGADAGAIVTVLSIRMNRDGSVASVTAGAQTGVNGSNQAYARQMADAARRAVLRCSPITGLPADLYQGGWDDFDFRFRPDAMQ